jgi:hypothetical protein
MTVAAPETTGPAGQGITTRGQATLKVSVDLTKPISDLDQAWRVATMLAQADALPMSLRGKPQNILVVMLAGLELGFTAMQSLRMVFVPKSGIPQLRGEALLIRLRAHGHDYDWEYTDDDNKCTFILIRGDGAKKTYRASFSLQDAILAELVQRKRPKPGEPEGPVEYVAYSTNGNALPWMQYRYDMLFWRAVARCVRRAAPEVTYGFDVMGAADGAPEDQPPGPVTLRPQAADQPDGGPGQPGFAAGQPAAETGPPPPEAPPEEEEPAGPPLPEQLAAELAQLNREGELAAGRQAADLADTVQDALAAELAGLGVTDATKTAEACSAFARRRVTGPGSLSDAEAGRLITLIRDELAGDQLGFAEYVSGWLADWSRDEPEAYGEWDQARADG